MKRKEAEEERNEPAFTGYDGEPPSYSRGCPVDSGQSKIEREIEHWPHRLH